jgi:hypothetical protein
VAPHCRREAAPREPRLAHEVEGHGEGHAHGSTVDGDAPHGRSIAPEGPSRRPLVDHHAVSADVVVGPGHRDGQPGGTPGPRHPPNVHGRGIDGDPYIHYDTQARGDP